jgi:hypothetical protein
VRSEAGPRVEIPSDPVAPVQETLTSVGSPDYIGQGDDSSVGVSDPVSAGLVVLAIGYTAGRRFISGGT